MGWRRDQVTSAAGVLLSISPRSEDHAVLRRILEAALWRVDEADGCETAFRFLSSRPVAAIVTNDRLPDGDWMCILGHVQAQVRPPNLIVASFHADDRLWAAVLNLGGYDVLSKPFDAGEVRWVVSRVCPPPAKGEVATRAA